MFHEELERKKKNSHLKGMHHEKNGGDDSAHDGGAGTDKEHSAQPGLVDDDMEGIETDTPTTIEKQLLILERKLKVATNISENMEPILDKLMASDGSLFPQYQYLTQIAPRKYTQKIITPLVLKWLLSVTPTDESPQKYTEPLEEMLNVTLRWYMIQKKRIVNYSSFLTRNNGINLNPLPDRDHAEILIRCFYESIVHTSLIDQISPTELFQTSQKYYKQGVEALTYSEVFFLNICLFGGLKFAVFQGINRSFLPDIEVLKDLASQLFCNVMTYYNNVSEGVADMLYLKGLLVLSKMCHLMLNAQVAYEILEQALRIALALGLNNESTYKDIDANISIVRRGVWAYLLARDRDLASDLSKPFLIKEAYLDYQSQDAYKFVFDDIILMHTAQTEKTVANGKKSKITDEDIERIRKMTNTRERIDVLVSYKEYTPFVLNYHTFQLHELHGAIYRCCFYVNTTRNVSFEEKFDEIVTINDRLRIWVESLSPAMRLDTYKEYFSLLGTKSASEGIDHEYEGLCTRVLCAHLHFYSLSSTVAQFALSIIRDNSKASMSTKKDLEKLIIAFENQFMDSAHQMLLIFNNFNNVSIRYLEIRQFVMSAIFTTTLYVIDNRDAKEKFIGNALSVKMLHKTYQFMLRILRNEAVPDNVQFTADLFSFAFLMKSVILTFNESNALADRYSFTTAEYDEIMQEMITKMKQVKAQEYEVLESRLTTVPEHGSRKLLTDMSIEFLELVKSDVSILRSTSILRHPTPKLEDFYEVVSMHPFKWDRSNDEPPSERTDSENHYALIRDDLFNNNDDFFKHFPYSEYFYDRGFAFDRILEELNL